MRKFCRPDSVCFSCWTPQSGGPGGGLVDSPTCRRAHGTAVRQCERGRVGAGGALLWGRAAIFPPFFAFDRREKCTAAAGEERALPPEPVSGTGRSNARRRSRPSLERARARQLPPGSGGGSRPKRTHDPTVESARATRPLAVPAARAARARSPQATQDAPGAGGPPGSGRAGLIRRQRRETEAGVEEAAAAAARVSGRAVAVIGVRRGPGDGLVPRSMGWASRGYP